MSPASQGTARLVLRSFFWEQTHPSSSGSWLNQLLSYRQDLTHQQQATLLYLILGPPGVEDSPSAEARDYDNFQRKQHFILYTSPDWNLPQETSPATFEEAKDLFSDIGKGLQLIQAAQKRSPVGSENEISSLLDAIFWLSGPAQNVVNQLTFTWIIDNRGESGHFSY